MSRAQGDGFRTHTDHELNAYKARLWAKTHNLINEKERWYKSGEGWILVVEANIINNPNGDWKWHGWEILGKRYEVRVFPGASVEIKEGKIRVIGLAQYQYFFEETEDADAKKKANEAFKEAQELARDLKEWINQEEKEFWNDPPFK